VIVVVSNGVDIAHAQGFDIPTELEIEVTPNEFINEAREWIMPLLIAFITGIAGASAFKILIRRF
jgi:hypothetical protein